MVSVSGKRKTGQIKQAQANWDSVSVKPRRPGRRVPSRVRVKAPPTGGRISSSSSNNIYSLIILLIPYNAMDGFPPDVLSFTLLAPVQLSQVHPLLLSVRRATADQGFSGFMFHRSLAMSAPIDVLRSCINCQ